jgi:hypothetical protein
MESMREGGSDQAGSGGVSRLPHEALDGVMRAWLEILHQRHPEVTWMPVGSGSREVTRPEFQLLKQASASMKSSFAVEANATEQQRGSSPTT